jgi:hypothetical protein
MFDDHNGALAPAMGGDSHIMHVSITTSTVAIWDPDLARDPHSKPYLSGFKLR